MQGIRGSPRRTHRAQRKEINQFFSAFSAFSALKSPVNSEGIMPELPKQYDPHEAQAKWLKFWDERGYAHSRPDPNREPYTIVIPPPNVTGALHMGHALNNTLQDVLIRWRRM